ncbi:hypothetical protein [Gemmatimonas sp.]|jgi:hypothetical protein|uniref:hypothetical protein n=1 Tax=Gemmatimonas sp. TaxID=1962908 RepID=UPI0022CCA2BC|nr:hypothetical protein [Gemmatimonas sp.]MCZ8203557.1 hypothetical protein [Gemmatimonas sp.]
MVTQVLALPPSRAAAQAASAARSAPTRPYTCTAGLVQQNILSAALYEKIADRIIAKP